MTKQNKLAQLAAMTTDSDLSPPPEAMAPSANPFLKATDPTAPRPQLAPTGQTSRLPTDPAPQRPMLTEADIAARSKRQTANPVVRLEGDPELSETIVAALIMTGLLARWNINHWRVYVPDASNIVANVGGGRRARWQTGIGRDATEAEWLDEISKFWKDIHPNEPVPFGQD